MPNVTRMREKEARHALGPAEALMEAEQRGQEAAPAGEERAQTQVPRDSPQASQCGTAVLADGWREMRGHVCRPIQQREGKIKTEKAEKTTRENAEPQARGGHRASR